MPPVRRQARRYSCSSRSSRALPAASRAWRDLVGGRLGQRDQQRVGVLAPAGQVDRADRLAGDRVVDRHPGAAEALQVLGVVLVAEDVGGPAALQRGADAVGADLLLGVAEAGGQLDPVEVRARGRGPRSAGSAPGPSASVRMMLIGWPSSCSCRCRSTGIGASGPGWSVQVGVAQVVQLDVVGGDLPLPGPPPGREDGLAHGALVDRLGGEKPISGLRQQIFRRVQRHRSTCHIASPTHCIPGWRVCPAGPGFTRPLQSKPHVPWHCLKLRLPS